MSTTPDIRRILVVDDADIVELVARSDAYLDALYPPESNFAEPLERLVTDPSAFFAAYVDDVLVACGAVKLIDEDACYGEIKRLYVDEPARGRGLATAMMQQLEAYAAAGGATFARIEVGTGQPEALALYWKLGYTERGPFGAYRPDTLCVFMEKRLVTVA